jgi:hypothetical protein
MHSLIIAFGFLAIVVAPCVLATRSGAEESKEEA